MFPSGSMIAASAPTPGTEVFGNAIFAPSLLKCSFNVRDIYVLHPWLSWVLPFHYRAIDSGTIRARLAQPVFRTGKRCLLKLPAKYFAVELGERGRLIGRNFKVDDSVASHKTSSVCLARPESYPNLLPGSFTKPCLSGAE